MEVVIDVGANKGEFALEILAKNPEILVLAIEPIPELCAEIRSVAAGMKRLSDIEVRCCAVDAQERTAQFHVADHADHGVSSLLSLSKPEIEQDDYWKTRGDLYFDKTIQVEVRRLDKILSQLDVDRIPFVKIDVQGLDIQVLHSMGEYLKCVDAGMLEITSTLDKRLYQGEEYDLHRALNALDEMGFQPYSIKPNDPASNEFNLFFCRRGLDIRALEQRLRLAEVPLYSAKDYWHAPSACYRPLQEMDVSLLQSRIGELDTEIARLNLHNDQSHVHIERQNLVIEMQQRRAEQAESEALIQQQRAEQAEQQLTIIYLSRSWAVTRPLRFFSRMLMKLMKRKTKGEERS